MFLGGAQAGHAWADMLTGAVNPSGRLPVTLPLREEDVTAPCATPGFCVHAEALHVGWRGLINQSVAFGFGHGLSYSTFEYELIEGPPAVAAAGASPPATSSDSGDSELGNADEDEVVLRVRVRVRNSGNLAGREIVQLYLTYPPDADEPPLVLRGFQPTAILSAAQDATVEFALSLRDVSVWDEAKEPAGWRPALGKYQVHIGASSRDLRLSATFELA